MQLLDIDSGQIIIDGRDTNSLSRRERRKTRGRIGMVFQNIIYSPA